MPTKWNDLEFYVADTWKVRPRVTLDYGVRWSMLFNYYTGDDKMTSFVPSLFNPALGNDPCNGLYMVPGTNPCQDAGYLGGTPGPNRSLQNEKYDAIAPRLGARLGRLRHRQDGRASGPGALLHARAHQWRAQLPRQPALRSHDRRPPVPRHQRRAVPWRLQRERRRALERPGGERGHPQLLDVEPHLRAAARAEHHDRAELRGHQAAGPAPLLRRRPGERHGDINGNGVSDRLDFIRAGGDTRRSGRRATVRGLRQRPHPSCGPTGARRNTTASRPRSSAASGEAPSSRPRTPGPSRPATWGWPTSGGIDANNSVTDLANPRLDWGPTLMNRPHIFNASLVLMLPDAREQVGLRQERARRLGDRVDRPGVLGAVHHRLHEQRPRHQHPLGDGLRRQPEAEPRGRRLVPGQRRGQGADPEPRTRSRSPASSWGRSATRAAASARGRASTRRTSPSTRTSASATG